MTPWPADQRLATMRKAVHTMADCLHRVNAHAYANTYGVPVAEVESEIIRCLPEGGDK